MWYVYMEVLRHYIEKQKEPVSIPTRDLAGLRDPTLLEGP